MFAACLSPTALGMESAAIPDEGITASSHSITTEGFHRIPSHARLGQADFWSNDNDDPKPWIQVDLGSTCKVTGLQTEGHSGSKWDYFVGNISVKVGMLETDLIFIENESGDTKASCFAVSPSFENFH